MYRRNFIKAAAATLSAATARCDELAEEDPFEDVFPILDAWGNPPDSKEYSYWDPPEDWE